MKKHVFSLLILIVAVSCIPGCKKEPPVSPNEVKAIFRATLPATADDKVWRDAPVHPAKMILQDMVEPRLPRFKFKCKRLLMATESHFFFDGTIRRKIISCVRPLFPMHAPYSFPQK
jgi:hypothetical protein